MVLQSEYSINIGVLHYKTTEKTFNCVNSILETTDECNIYIIDNYSNDGSIEELKAKFDDVSNVHFVCLDENKGFAKANNFLMRLLKEKGERNVVLTNNDIVFQGHAIQAMIKELNDTQAILVAPKVVNPDGEVVGSVQKSTPTNVWSYFYRKKKAYSLPPAKKNISTESISATPIKMFSGCCFACDLEMMERIGYFDENTFLYYEELILSKKIQSAGYKMYFVPSAQVMHYHGATTSSVHLMAIGCEIESEVYYLKEYLGANKYFLRLYVYYRRFKDKKKYNSECLYNKESSIIASL